MLGQLVLVVGPSGAGKDSLIEAAKTEFATDPTFVFPRRVVTRNAMQAAEDHDTLSSEAFVQALQQGAFFLHWQAHDLSYGLPAKIKNELLEGKVVVVNVSRTILAQAAAIWPRTSVLVITAPPHVLAERVAARARKEDGDIQKRITREVENVPDNLPRITIRNDRTLAEAAEDFCTALEHLVPDKGAT